MRYARLKEGPLPRTGAIRAAGNLQVYGISIIQEKNRGRGQLEKIFRFSEKNPRKTRSSGIRSSSGFAGSPRASCAGKGASRAPRILKAGCQFQVGRKNSPPPCGLGVPSVNPKLKEGRNPAFRAVFPPSFKLGVCYPFSENRSTSNRRLFPIFSAIGSETTDRAPDYYTSRSSSRVRIPDRR